MMIVWHRTLLTEAVQGMNEGAEVIKQGKAGLSRLLIGLSISGFVLWLQVYAFQNIQTWFGSIFDGMGSGMGEQLNQLEPLFGGLGFGMQDEEGFASVFSGLDLAALGAQFGIDTEAAGNILGGIFGFWLEWGLIISAAALVIGIVVSSKPFRTLAFAGVIFGVLMLFLPRIVSALAQIAVENDFGGSLLQGYLPGLLLANEELSQVNVFLALISFGIAAVALLLHLVFKRHQDSVQSSRSDTPHSA